MNGVEQSFSIYEPFYQKLFQIKSQIYINPCTSYVCKYLNSISDFPFQSMDFLLKINQCFSHKLINSYINNMFDTNIHLSGTLLNEYFLATLQYFLEHLAFGTFARALYNTFEISQKWKKYNFFRGCVYIFQICNDNYKLMQFIFIPFSPKNLLITFRLWNHFFDIGSIEDESFHSDETIYLRCSHIMLLLALEGFQWKKYGLQ